MTYKAKVTTRGQMTIPQPVREALQIQEGDEVYVYVVDQRRAAIEVVGRKKPADLYGTLKTAEPAPGYETMRRTAKEHLGKQHLAEQSRDTDSTTENGGGDSEDS